MKPTSRPSAHFPDHPRWIGKRGYALLRWPGHPNANPRTHAVPEHIAMVSRAIGKPLRHSVHVHHVNNIKTDNAPSNLVACQDAAYHALLHVRQRALDACGNPSWRRCRHCGRYSDPKTMQRNGRRGGDSWRHRECHTIRMRGTPHPRKTCRHGHPFRPETTGVDVRGRRQCLVCHPPGR